jgi:hypothetical protein
MYILVIVTKSTIMRFETKYDVERELKAALTFCGAFGFKFTKLGPNDVDYVLTDKNDEMIGYLEVKGRNRDIEYAFPLPIACRKLVKLSDKKLYSVVVWSCYDGIIYGNINNLKGDVRFGGRRPRDGAVNDLELMAYYPPQYALSYIKF